MRVFVLYRRLAARQFGHFKTALLGNLAAIPGRKQGYAHALSPSDSVSLTAMMLSSLVTTRMSRT